MTKKKLLIVEDEADLREVIQYFVRDHFDVTEASNGIEALEKLQHDLPDLILSDFNMPHLDGLEFLKILFERNIRIPVVWITGRGGPDLYKSAWSLGVYDFIEKPFSPDQLVSCLTGALSLSLEADLGPASASSERSLSKVSLMSLQVAMDRNLYNKLSEFGLKTGSSVTSLINEKMKEFTESDRVNELL